MKKALCIVLIALMLMLCGCGAKKESEPLSDQSMFVVVEKGINHQVVYHKDTKVMYVISYGMYNGGTFVIMLNADGTPQVWKGAEDDSDKD